MDRAAILTLCRKLWIQLLLVFLASLAIMFWQARDRWHQAPYADEVTYMSVALPLYETGIYQDGTFRGTSGHEGKNGEGMFFAPLYPAFLTGLMNLSPSFTNTVKCSVQHRKPVEIERHCAPLDLRVMIVAQIFLMALGAMCTWVSAYTLTAHRAAAWMATLFAFTGTDYVKNATVAMSEGILLPLFSFSVMAALIAWRNRTFFWTVLSGVGFGLLCLAKPSFAYLLFCAVPFLTALACLQLKKQGAKPLTLVLLFALVCGAITAPWVIRNGTKMGIWDISYGLAPFTFAQRVAFNDMTWTEWMTSFVYGLPSFGDNLSEDIFPKESYIRHDFGHPDGFYQYGNLVLRPEIAEKAGNYDAQFPYQLKHYLLNQPFKHVMVTISLAWRGMWAGGKLALFTVPALAAFMIVALRRKKWDFLFYAGIPVFMLGFHAFTSVNITRYNLILLPAMGVAFAWMILWAWRKWKTKDNTALPGWENKTS